MLDIKLPDGKIIQFKNYVNGFKLVEKISKSLAKEACIMSVDGKLKDLSYEIKKNSTVRIITSKDKEGSEKVPQRDEKQGRETGRETAKNTSQKGIIF